MLWIRSRGCMHNPFLAQKSYQITWCSSTLDFSLGFSLVFSFLRNPRLLVLAYIFSWITQNIVVISHIEYARFESSPYNTQNQPNLIHLKTKRVAANQRNARLCVGESKKFGFMDYKSSAQCAYTLWALQNSTLVVGSESRKATKISPTKRGKN